MDIRDASEQDLLDALKDRGIDARPIEKFSDEEIEQEYIKRVLKSRREAEQLQYKESQYKVMMDEGLV